MTQNLIKVSTYAKVNNKSLAWAYKQIEEKKVPFTIIDGVKFIILGKKK
jgi:hypothetical protein